jgi:hypothetical protein
MIPDAKLKRTSTLVMDCKRMQAGTVRTCGDGVPAVSQNWQRFHPALQPDITLSICCKNMLFR